MGQEFLTRLPYMIAAFLPALTFHEWAHAMVAYRLGDTTAKRQGRLTLNPFAHLDTLGTILVFVAGVGWAQPVPIDARNFRNSWGEFWVAAAGPLMNITLAIIFAVTIRLGAPYWFGPDKTEIVSKLLFISLQLNLALAFFNLIPIGPLDGHHILTKILPLHASIKFAHWNAAYGSIIILMMVILEFFTPFRILTWIIFPPVHLTQNFLLS